MTEEEDELSIEERRKAVSRKLRIASSLCAVQSLKRRSYTRMIGGFERTRQRHLDLCRTATFDET